jgi:hypothetical protein
MFIYFLSSIDSIVLICPYMSLYILIFGCFSFCNMLLGFRLGGQGLLQLLQLRRMLGLKRLRGMDVGSRRSNPI